MPGINMVKKDESLILKNAKIKAKTNFFTMLA